MPNAEIGVLDLGMQPARQCDARLGDPGQQVCPADARREAWGRHGMGGNVCVQRHLPQTQGGNARLARPADALMPGKARRQALLQNLPQADVERKHQVDRRGAKIGRLAGFVGLHHRQPVVPVGIVAAHGRLAVLQRGQGARPSHQQRQPRRHTNRLLRGREGHIHAPGVHIQVFARQRADTVHDHQRAVTLTQRCQAAHIGQHTGRGIHLGDGHHLEAAALQGLLHSGQRGVPARRGPHLSDLCAVAFQNGANAVAKIAGVDHQRGVSRLDQIGAGGIHAEGAGTRQHKRLAVGALEEGAGALQRLTKGFDKLGRQVAGGGRAQRGKHSRVKLNGTRNHQQGAVFHGASLLWEMWGDSKQKAAR